MIFYERDWSFSFELENILEGDFFQADELPEVLDSMREAREPESINASLWEE